MEKTVNMNGVVDFFSTTIAPVELQDMLAQAAFQIVNTSGNPVACFPTEALQAIGLAYNLCAVAAGKEATL